MFKWNESIQKIIDYLEEHLCENPSLLEMSNQIGYSPYYCSTRFHEIVGMTIKSYVAGRRLAKATIEIRDTDHRILDIAITYGYSSQEALTRAFVHAYGCTPAAYRKKPRPLKLSIRQEVLPPYQVKKGEDTMNETCLTNPNVRMEFIPAHKYVGIWDENANGYGDFWRNHDCDEITGIVESMSHVSDPVVAAHTAGWFLKNGKRGYFYGFGVPLDYEGEIPEGFSIKQFPESYYYVFYHPTFDYRKDNSEVMKRVEQLAWNYDLTDKGYEWNELVCQDYQRHNPEILGYQVLRPVRKLI
ncbi:helix-turn-helix transcriptional regulator [Lachnoclostridium sp.]|uniref:helix-turn-helix transcriptional regulator n=1 Tax=Lachnoclostridium sp. TaxID=2028282 RepID=UPI00289C9C15|nr:AraC family transcriptional regulator [Lachnoclostridium sp.]